jgi:predicted ribosome quality control (RQC) complex YloA/Tae2 family protein
MVKSRFTTLDVAAMVSSVRPHILGARVANVYDIGGKLFLIKFSSSLVTADDDDTDAGKATLLIEAGVRFHLTSFERKKSPIPSGWTMNLRKLLRGKQLERIDQAGSDRVVVLQFGINEKAIYVILELYAKGNVIVTDASYKVQLLLRSHTFETGGSVAKNEVYPISQAATVMSPVKERWEQDEEIFNAVKGVDVSGLERDIQTALQSSKRKKKHLATSTAERVLGKIIPFAHSDLLQRSLLEGCRERNIDSMTIFKKSVEFAQNLLEKAKSATEDAGYISFSSSGGPVVDFSPLEELVSAGEVKKLSSFSAAVDEYFSAIETTGEADKVESQRQALTSKVEKIKADQMRRISDLNMEQQSLWRQADLLEANLEAADAGISILNALIGKQMTWAEISETVALQGRNGHPIAERIVKIDFTKNRILFVLNEEEKVWLDLAVNATGNVNALHALRKHQKDKLGKTEQQAALAIKVAEQKLRSDLSKFDDSIERDRHLAKVRRRFWFEKFYWFITSEGFLVIAGRDATQNEAIYRKYLKSRDVYVHADIHGAATVVVKNHLSSGDVPPLSLSEAGQFSLCHSSAWSSKIVTSAWWVRAEQVSKTAPTGEYLTTGSFMIRGRKNFLPPSRLELGVGVLFYVSEECQKARPPERSVRSQHDEQGIPGDSMADPGIVSIVTTDQVVRKVKPVLVKKNDKKEVPVAPVVVASEKKKSTGASKGAKGKNKKKEKYVFDDDLEDERIRQKLLGIKTPLDEAEAGPSEAQQEPSKETVNTVKVCYVCGSDEHLASECPSKPKKLAPVVDEGEDEEVTATAGSDSLVLERLVGTVSEIDEMVHAVAVCGPYSALGTCQLKAKIVPGSTKRGKAAKLCSQMFGGSGTNVPTAAKKLIKLIPVEEFSECLVNDVKVAAAGVTKLQVDSKKAKKLNAKSSSAKN